jgi:hypothetical protein
MGLGEPWAFVEGELELGEALAETGDVTRACRMFARVQERWGHAEPRSLTAEQAARRSIALGCAPPPIQEK